MVKDGISTEDVKKTLAGLRDGSMEIGDNSISVHKESKVDDKTHNHKGLENSVVVNELNASQERATDMSYVLIGMGQNGDDYYAVRSVVSKQTNNVSQIDIFSLGGVKGKNIENPNSTLKRGAAVSEQGSVISSDSHTISIADLFENVKAIPLINEIFSKDVADKLGIARTSGTLTPDLRYSFKENSSDTKKPTSYTKAEAAEMVSGILTELFSAPEYAGKIKNMSDAVKMAMSTLNGAEAGNATMHQKTEKAQP